jgi:hypothetical protein
VPEYNSTGEGQSQHFWQTNLIYPVVARLFSIYLDYACQMLIFNLWKRGAKWSLARRIWRWALWQRAPSAPVPQPMVLIPIIYRKNRPVQLNSYLFCGIIAAVM